MPTMRLQRFLSQAGVAARRKAETLILRGLVTVNGEVVTTLGTKVDSERDQVTVEGEAVAPEDHVYAILNKPKACITAKSDPEGRRTVMEFVPGLPASAAPVGRLDFYSEGVLLFTNDGELAAALLSPATHVEKSYHVKIQGRLSDADLAALRSGVRIGPRTKTREAQVNRIKSSSRHDWLVITLIEGKSRQIHRMMEALGHTIIKLQRVAFAGITFHGLRVGDARELSQAEVNDLRAAAGLDRDSRAVSRGKWAMRREDTDASRRAADRLRTIPTPSPTPGGSRRAAAKLRLKDAELGSSRPPARASAPRPGPRADSRAAKKPTSRPSRGSSAAPPSRGRAASADPRGRGGPERDERQASGPRGRAGSTDAGRQNRPPSRERKASGPRSRAGSTDAGRQDRPPSRERKASGPRSRAAASDPRRRGGAERDERSASGPRSRAASTDPRRRGGPERDERKANGPRGRAVSAEARTSGGPGQGERKGSGPPGRGRPSKPLSRAAVKGRGTSPARGRSPAKADPRAGGSKPKGARAAQKSPRGSAPRRKTSKPGGGRSR